jgi:hypothetical protein
MSVLGSKSLSEFSREPIHLPGGPLAKVRYAPIATKLHTAPK